MNSIKVLDVTLRDGGCVNNFNFGQVYMEKILSSIEQSGVEIIELGYIDENKGSEKGRTQYINEQVISKYLLKNKKRQISYVAMIDYGKFDVNKLQSRSETSIDGIRVAFHKKDMKSVLPVFKKIKEKGYDVYVQPMITLRYSDSELLELIDQINTELPNVSGFYIVDSFGEMRPNDMSRILSLVDHNLIPSMLLGFHSHNNLQMSYSNACAMLQFPTNRDLMLDSSIMGMGKGAGNLNTELLLEHLNLFYGKNYDINPLLHAMDKVINQLHSEFYWGYAPEYYLSAANHCTPSYASHYYNKHMLPINQVAELLSLIKEDKKISFDKDYAEKLYRNYNERISIDDENVIKEMQSIFMGKSVLLIAPGKSILSFKSNIESVKKIKGIISIGLNLTDHYDVDYILTTRQDLLDSSISKGISVITTSNISKGFRGDVKILNYKKWVDISDQTHDSSSVIALNMLKACKVNKIYLAGFDGFSTNIKDNYYDTNLRYPVNEEQALKRNKYYKKFISNIKQFGIQIQFITPSRYE